MPMSNKRPKTGRTRQGFRRMAGAVGAAAISLALACSSTSPLRACEADSQGTCPCASGGFGTGTCNSAGTAFLECKGCPVADSGADAGADTSAPPSDSGVDVSVNLCQNGVVDPGEGCDDGNNIPDDGCSAECVPQGNPTSANLCPGQPVHVWDKAVTFDGTTTTYGAGYMAKSSADCTGLASESGGPDHLYAVTPHTPGTMTVTTTIPVTSPTFQNTLYVRTTCDNQDSQTACVNLQSSGTGETLSFGVVAGLTYYVFVDSGLNAGDYTVTFEVQ